MSAAEEAEAVLVEIWLSYLTDAYRVSRGERLGELRGKRSKLLDARGLHPLSEAWGGAHALERVLPWLGELRAGDGGEVDCHPVTLRRIAYQDAEAAFAEELAEHGAQVWER